jgi:hypothetical protein
LGKEFRKYLQHLNLSKEDPAIKERAHPAGSGTRGRGNGTHGNGSGGKRAGAKRKSGRPAQSA